VDPNGRIAIEGTSKIFELFAISKNSLAWVLRRGARGYRPQFGPPISADLRKHNDERQFRLGNE
jgi:hypothetical protein